MSISVWNKDQQPVSEASEVELTPRQQTLFIGGFFSVCGNCDENADPIEKNHDMLTMSGDGCGVTWQYVATDVPGIDFSHLRPDLQAVEMDRSADGVTGAMEDRIIGGMAVIETFKDSAQ